MTFGERLRALRKKRHMTQKELSKALFISERVISYYEQNERFPNDAMTLIRIAEYFDVSCSSLLICMTKKIKYIQPCKKGLPHEFMRVPFDSLLYSVTLVYFRFPMYLNVSFVPDALLCTSTLLHTQRFLCTRHDLSYLTASGAAYVMISPDVPASAS